MSSAIESCFTSPNECDSNLEPANVVDGLYEMARAIYALSKSMDKLSYEVSTSIKETGENIATAIPQEITVGSGQFPIEIRQKVR